MRRAVRGWAVVAFLVVATGVGAQARPSLRVVLPPHDSLGSAGPWVAAREVLADRRLRELLDAGFPAQLRYRVELWSTGGWFNRQVAATEWSVVVRFDPLAREFEGVRVLGDSVVSLGRHKQFADMAAEVERAWRPAIRPPRDDAPQYYNVTLTLEMLSVTDLDELQRWVRGDLRPAVRGQRNPGTALGRGARTLLSRLLGGERRTLDARSESFVVR